MPAASRALILHLSVPPWASGPETHRAWTEVIAPCIDAIVAAETPVGLVMAGRLFERIPDAYLPLVERLIGAVTVGRVEMLATALEDALLASVPQADAIGQITAHAALVRRCTGARPTGCWIPGGHWDPGCPVWISSAGLGWTHLDRRWLDEVDAPSARVLGIERLGHSVSVVPSIPLSLRSWKGLAVLEVTDARSLRTAVGSLPRASVLPSELMVGVRARTHLPADDAWNRALLTDAGADQLHKRMLAVSRLAGRLDRRVADSRHQEGGLDPQRLLQVRRYLYRAQNRAALAESGSHRERAWRDLVRAENRALELLGRSPPVVRKMDADCDGHAEVRMLTERWAVTLAPAREGALTELVHRRSGMNLLAGPVPTAFRERWQDGLPVATEWPAVETTMAGSRIQAGTRTTSLLNGRVVRILKSVAADAAGPIRVSFALDAVSEPASGALHTECFFTLGPDAGTPLVIEMRGKEQALEALVRGGPTDSLIIRGSRVRIEIRSESMRYQAEPIGHCLRLELSWAVDVGLETTTVQLGLGVREVRSG